jgi:hypothetical protein
MRFQLPPRPESLNHIPIPYVNSLSVKLIDGKPYILSLKGEVLRRRGIIQCEPEVKPNRMLDDGGNW